MLALGAFVVLTASCGNSDDGDGPNREQVVANYAEIVQLNYQQTLAAAEAMKAAIDRFVSDPTPASHEAAKRAWLDARVPYGQTEAFRFYGGPIDDANGPEGALNSWPLDEAYVDYVDGAADAGIVNDPSIAITRENLVDLNAGGMGDITGIGNSFDGDKAISVGYHAVEFLLWGQDRDPNGPGSRPYTDFLTTQEATAPNGDRRGLYLQVAAALIVDDLQYLVDQWAPDGAYRSAFIALPVDEALTKMLTGAGILSKGELAAERMDVALETLDQEDEQSCFSDNTHTDLMMDALGIQNVWLGNYGWHDGPGIDELVGALDPEAAARTDAAIRASIEAIAAIPSPFDRAISSSGSPGWNAVDTAVDRLFDQAGEIVAAGTVLGLSVGVELPE